MRPGSLIASRFVLERLAGTGGMGSVYRARDQLTGGVVALKVAHGTSADAESRFAREAAVLADLRHPAIVGFVAHGREPDGTLYLAMEWVEGTELGERIARQPLAVAEAIAVVQRVADALGAAHARGVVHRDVKPSNVLLRSGDLAQPRVLDFGVARLAEDVSMTRTGMVLGTPAYMAPEQARGERDVDPRADVFALGSLLFECLAGKPPFFADHPMGALAKILLQDAPSVRERRRDVPEEVDLLLRRMLAKDRDERPSSGRDVAEALAAIELHPESRMPASLFRPALTEGEQRFFSVLLVGDGAASGARGGEAATLDPALAPTRAGPDALGADAADVEAIVEAHGGRVERLAGGALVVSIRGVGAATDQAARAARCALAIRAIRPEAPMALSMGRSLVQPTTRGSQRTRLPAGEVIDRGAALIGAEAPSSRRGGARIRIDEVTAGLLDGRFDVGGDAGGLCLDGEREVADVGRTLLGKPTPCVGRERDLGVLRGLYDECVSAPMARAALVTAGAGVGKSRLLRELVQKLEAGTGGAPPSLWVARGDPMSAGSPFGMLGQILRSAAGAAPGEPLAVRQQKIRARVGRHVARDAVARTAEFLGEIAGAPFPASPTLAAARQDARLMGDLMQTAWEELLGAESSAAPVVLVLEDLHWGDLPTVQAIDRALKNLEDRSLLVLASARPEVHEVFPRLWAERALEEVKLADLSRPSCKRLVRAVLGDAVSEETVQHVIERAAGNAFYLEELVRAIAEGKVAPGGRGGAAALPETVLAMVEARLETLSPELRRVLRAASVFGQVFWQDGVAALLGVEARDLEHDLAQLERQELVSRRGESGFRGTAEYAFRHGLVREAAHATLTAADAALGHRLAGEWLEAAGESDSLVLAEHFERGAAPDRAVAWYERAAAQALEGNDHGAAIERGRSAVRCGAAGEVLGRVLTTISEAHSWRGEYRTSLEVASAAMPLLRHGSREWLRIVTRVASAAARIGERDTVNGLARALRDLGAERAHPRPSTWSELALMVAIDGELELADALLAQGRAALGLAPDADAASLADAYDLAHYYHACAAVEFVRSDDPSRMRATLDLAIAAFDRAHDTRNACQARANAGYASIELGAYEEAVAMLTRAVGDSDRLGLMNVAASAHQNLGLAFARLGRLDEATSHETLAVEAFSTSGDARMKCSSMVYLAEIARMRGALADAERQVRAAIAIVREGTPMAVVASAELARILVAQGRAQEALVSSAHGYEMSERLGGGGEGNLAARVAHAEALHATGAIEAARDVIEKARAHVLARAARLQGPAAKAYVERVPEVARILALAEAWTSAPR